MKSHDSISAEELAQRLSSGTLQLYEKGGGGHGKEAEERSPVTQEKDQLNGQPRKAHGTFQTKTMASWSCKSIPLSVGQGSSLKREDTEVHCHLQKHSHTS